MDYELLILASQSLRMALLQIGSPHLVVFDKVALYPYFSLFYVLIYYLNPYSSLPNLGTSELINQPMVDSQSLILCLLTTYSLLLEQPQGMVKSSSAL